MTSLKDMGCALRREALFVTSFNDRESLMYEPELKFSDYSWDIAFSNACDLKIHRLWLQSPDDDDPYELWFSTPLNAPDEQQYLHLSNDVKVWKVYLGEDVDDLSKDLTFYKVASIDGSMIDSYIKEWLEATKVAR